MQRLDIDLGLRLVPYHEGWRIQRRVHDEVASGRRASTLIALEHESVYTVGRRAHTWERPEGAFVEPGHVPVVDVDRGGKTTWHGPGQLTVYPIVHLAPPVDVIRYVRALEAAVMDVCAAYGLATVRVGGRSGVWVSGEPASCGPFSRAGCDERKVCALGVRVARDVTMHGIGLNVDTDLAGQNRAVRHRRRRRHLADRGNRAASAPGRRGRRGPRLTGPQSDTAGGTGHANAHHMIGPSVPRSPGSGIDWRRPIV